MTTARRTREGPEGIILHRVRHPPAATRVHGIAVTTVPQTVLDLAATVPAGELERIIREVHATRAVAPQELLAFAERVGAKPGGPALRRALGSDPGTRSSLERRFLALCKRAGLQPPLVNAVVAGLEVDFLWPAQRLVVETDGFATHATRHGFERDRRRDALLTRAGLRVLHLSDRQIGERRTEVVEALRAAGVQPA